MRPAVLVGRGSVAAALLVVALCLLAVSPVSAADGPDGGVVGAEGSDVLRVVSSAQSEVEADPDSDPDRRLVDRESSERIDAVVIALWTIAGVMMVLLGLFLWHTSPRRRLRLAGDGSAGLSDDAEDGAAPAEKEPGEAEPEVDEPGEAEPEEDEPGEDSSKGGVGAMVREALLRLRSRQARQQKSEPAGDGSQQKSESVGDGSQQESESADDSEANGEPRSV